MNALAQLAAALLDAIARLGQPLVAFLVARWAVEGRAARDAADRLARQRDVAARPAADPGELLRRMQNGEF